MTVISYRATPLGRELYVDGHSGRIIGNEQGGNILCAALSALVQTMAKAVFDAEDENAADVIDVTLKSGQAHISYITDDETLNIQCDGIAKGFELICDSYPELVSYNA